jgi:hypothetical protein
MVSEGHSTVVWPYGLIMVAGICCREELFTSQQEEAERGEETRELFPLTRPPAPRLSKKFISIPFLGPQIPNQHAAFSSSFTFSMFIYNVLYFGYIKAGEIGESMSSPFSFVMAMTSIPHLKKTLYKA